jgi:CBS domain-containing protein
MRQAQDIMTSVVISVSPDSSLADAVEMIVANRISGLPVIDQSGELVGILSEADRLNLSIGSTSSVDDARVADYMTSSVITVEYDTELSEIADVLMRHGIRRVPVINQGSVVGIISRRDLLRGLYEDEHEAATNSESALS